MMMSVTYVNIKNKRNFLFIHKQTIIHVFISIRCKLSYTIFIITTRNLRCRIKCCRFSLLVFVVFVYRCFWRQCVRSTSFSFLCKYCQVTSLHLKQ